MINKILKFLFSMKFAMLLLIIFAFSLGYATFIEDDFGTPTAKALIYNSRWFELLMMVLGISLILNMFQHKLFRKEKLATLTFHLSFIIILFGAFVTRYTGDSGLMVIEEGSSNGKFYTSDSYFQIEILDDNMPGKIYRNDKLLNLRGNFDDKPFFFLKYLSSNKFSISEKETIFSKNVLSQDFKVEYVDFLTNINDKTESQSDEMMDGMNHALIVKTTSIGNTRIDTLINFSMNDAVYLEEQSKESYKNIFTLGSLTFKLWYGTKVLYLDPVKEDGKTEPGFSIFLKDFQLENYPGGMEIERKPKSFASEVEVIDGEKTFPYRIYMNHTLNYKGYRFFQNNYDKGDKKTTVLEVNYDWWGTNITYCGYLLMALGMILVFFQKKTRFRYLSEKLREIRSKSLLVIFFLTSLVSLSQDSSINNHSDHTDLESVRKSINEMGTWISGDTVINGVSIYEIFNKGRDDIEYLINYPIININKVQKYFPEIKDSMISYSDFYEINSYQLNHDYKKAIEKYHNDSLLQLNDSEKKLMEFMSSVDMFSYIIDIYSKQYMDKISLSLNQFQYDFKEKENQIINKYNIYSKEWKEFRDSIEETATEFIKNHKFDSKTISDFERLLVLDNSRIKPMHSMALEFTRKITQSNKGLYGQKPIEIFLGILSYPDYWKEVPLIKIKHSDIQKLFNKEIEYISYVSYENRRKEDEEGHKSHLEESCGSCIACFSDKIPEQDKNRSKSQKEFLELQVRFYSLKYLFDYRFNIMPTIYNLDAESVDKEDPNRWDVISKIIDVEISITSKSEESFKSGTQVNIDEMDKRIISAGQSIDINNIGITLNNPDEKSLNFYYNDKQLTFYYHDTLEYMKMPPDGTGKKKVFKKTIKLDADNQILITIDNKSFLIGKRKITTKNASILKLPRIIRYAYLIRSNQFEKANVELDLIKEYQKEHGLDYTKKDRPSLIPSDFKISLEILYNKIDIFFWLFIVYMTMGIILLSLLIIERFKRSSTLHFFIKMSKWLIITSFIIHTSMLIVRWIISEHAPWSDGYEAMIYVAWASILSGFIFSRKSLFTLPSTVFVSGVILLVAWMNSMNPVMDPQITALQPVLDSYWLMIHVELIIASYAFFFLSSLLGLLSLILMIVIKESNKMKLRLLIDEFTLMNEQIISIGLFVLTIGTFIGGVWAAESWGRYWGWDSKETWALISILVYAFVLHARFIPGLKGKYIFNLMSVWSVYSIIMTFWGVNYLFSGLHSYGAGEDVGIPIYIWISVLAVIIISILAKLNHKRHEI